MRNTWVRGLGLAIVLSPGLLPALAPGQVPPAPAPPAPVQAQAPAAAYIQPGGGYYVPPYVPPPPPPPVMLGVYVDLAYVAGPYGLEPGVRITSVWPGYPSYGRLDPGDIITRVNGMRVRSVPEFQGAMASAGPYVYLRLRDVRTGAIVDVPPIPLQPIGYPAAAAAPVAASIAAPDPGAPAAPGAPAPPGPNVP